MKEVINILENEAQQIHELIIRSKHSADKHSASLREFQQYISDGESRLKEIDTALKLLKEAKS